MGAECFPAACAVYLRLVRGLISTLAFTTRDVNGSTRVCCGLLRRSYRSSLCVRFLPSELAIAAMYLGSKFSSIGLPEGYLLTACSNAGVVLSRIERT